MTWNPRSLVVLALVAVASAATATLAQKVGAEKSALGDFVRVDNQYLRISRIDAVTFLEDRVVLTISGGSVACDPKDGVDVLRTLGLPRIEVPKAGR